MWTWNASVQVDGIFDPPTKSTAALPSSYISRYGRSPRPCLVLPTKDKLRIILIVTFHILSIAEDYAKLCGYTGIIEQIKSAPQVATWDAGMPKHAAVHLSPPQRLCWGGARGGGLGERIWSARGTMGRGEKPLLARARHILSPRSPAHAPPQQRLCGGEAVHTISAQSS